jgi:ATP-binding cassette subfamily B protein/ATP-binding cassette subfamily B multidrug efflux pump
MEGRTTLMIAHRLSTIRHAAHVLVVDGGRVVEQGSPVELLRRDGLFARLWEAQAGPSTNGSAGGAGGDRDDPDDEPDARLVGAGGRAAG